MTSPTDLKRRSMTEITYDVDKNNKQKPSSEQISGLFDILENQDLTERSEQEQVENDKKEWCENEPRRT